MVKKFLKSFFSLSNFFLIFFFIGCNENTPIYDEDVVHSVGKGIHLNLKNIHSHHKKLGELPKKRQVPWGAPLSACKPNMPPEWVIDSDEILKKYTTLNDEHDEERRVLLRYAQPLQERFYGNRWGKREFEEKLIDNSYLSLPVFDIFDINFGPTAAGAGLYMDPTPIGSFQYALNAYSEEWKKKNYDRGSIMLTTIVVPKGTFYLKRNDLPSSLWPYIRNDVEEGRISKKVFPAPLLVAYNSNSVNQNNKSAWHVLKTAEKVEAKEFDGQEFSTKDLLTFEKILKIPAQENFNNHDMQQVLKYYQGRVIDILSKRTYKPGIEEEIPAPLTALYPASVWGRFQELKHCIGAKIPHPLKDPLYYYWRYNGTCGGYADEKAELLVVNPEPIHNRDQGFDALLAPENQPCIEQFKPKAVWIQEGNGYFCRDAIPTLDITKKRENPLYYDPLNYIIIGKHSNSEDCGKQPNIHEKIK